jgi:hypothetical protein
MLLLRIYIGILIVKTKSTDLRTCRVPHRASKTVQLKVRIQLKIALCLQASFNLIVSKRKLKQKRIQNCFSVDDFF